MSSASDELLPWGRLELLEKPEKSLITSHDLRRSKHCIGRVAKRCDIVIDKQFISTVHCVISLQGKDSRGEPIVEIEDKSRYGTWVDKKKIGYRQKTTLKSGSLIHLTPPRSKEMDRILYRFELLPSGFTAQNEALHAQISADEMSVADRTRKRTIEETQSTQSPSASQVSPPRPRPIKKPRRTSTGNNSQMSSTPLTQQVEEESPAKPTMSAKAAGKRRRRLEVPAEDSEIATKMRELQEQYDRLSKTHVDVIIKMTRETDDVKARLATVESEFESKLDSNTKELTKLQQEHEALKKNYEEKLAALRNQAAAATRQLDDRDEENRVLREERDGHKRMLDHVLTDHRTPHQVRSVVELDAKILQLERQLKSLQDDLHVRSHHGLTATSGGVHSETTPPPKAQLVEIERQHELARYLLASHQARALNDVKRKQLRRQWDQLDRIDAERVEQVNKLTESIPNHSQLSGSSQSQDSIDLGRRRSSQGSNVSNENSEPSPVDVPQTHDPIDNETKSGDPVRARPDGSLPVFNRFGVRSATASSAPPTLSQPRFFRAKAPDRSSANEETKGP
ncbi:hypothetical protein PHYBOEH_007179 [Phytophthora boehmeriae]|uniref:FHA domain-containing protein n=1 Tax=Phytophthora boehmeriae TaxID=109152 RepID=A0A8T1W7P1_9STRA|nr:hypothetical protein PHYBOEH_007179 [Phytophthora boehmeriae]